MPADPPPYPRVPHLFAGSVRGRDDDVLDAESERCFLADEVLVEEKLDGANVALWLGDHGAVAVATRGGPDAQDRGRQRGPLRAWAAERSDALRELLAGGWVLYGEWLWRRHGVSYDRLPDWLVGLDLWHPEHAWASVEDRDRRCTGAGVLLPPRIRDWGRLRGPEEVESLLRRSAFGEAKAEGVVLRRRGPRELRLAKVVTAGYQRLSDAEWPRGERNSLAA
jgi:hypothetical protein